MKISELIEQLEKIKNKHGDIETTCTHSLLPDGHPGGCFPEIFETTVEHILIREPNETFPKRVRLYF